MSESQPPEYNPDANPQGVAAPEQQAPEPWSPPGYQAPVPPQYQPSGVVQSPQYGGAPAMTELTAAERFWYLLGNIAFGAMYLMKVPAKKAFSDFGLVQLTEGENTWYIVLCIMYGRGYFDKIPVAKAITETDQLRPGGYGQIPAAGFGG